ncbi:MAG: metal-dependent hydrolase [Rudaea sp.]
MHPSTPLNLRRFAIPFASQQIPRHWCGGDPVVSHLLNTYTVLCPGNEGYYIRTLQRAVPRLEDPQLAAVVRMFCLQEGQHGVGHRRYWKVLTEQGYTFERFEKAVAAFAYKGLERITPLAIRVSMVACVEHINAFLGEEFIRGDLLHDAEPQVKALFEWHFAEEIEHKNVAFDVLRAVAPSYPVRVLGALLVVPFFYILMMTGTLNFLRQDRAIFKRSTWRGFRLHFWGRDHMARRTIAHLWNYLRPGFHPEQTNNRHLAAAVIARYAAMETPPIEWIEERERARAA